MIDHEKTDVAKITDFLREVLCRFRDLCVLLVQISVLNTLDNSYPNVSGSHISGRVRCTEPLHVSSLSRVDWRPCASGEKATRTHSIGRVISASIFIKPITI